MTLLTLMLTFMQVGAFSVGGGYAAMPADRVADGGAARMAERGGVRRPGDDRRNDPRPDCHQRGDVCRDAGGWRGRGRWRRRWGASCRRW